MRVEAELGRATDVPWAAGMVVAYRGGTLEQAIVWMEQRARESACTVDDIVRDVLARRLRPDV